MLYKGKSVLSLGSVKMPLLLRVVVLLVAASVCGSASYAVTIFQTDDFQGGTTQGWTNGPAGVDPVNIANGGPSGTGDRYLQVTADGIGATGRLVSFNRSQWLGNYLTAGVTAIEMDLKNFGTSQLSMRIALKQSTAAGAPGFITNVPFLLPADGAWHHVVFGLDTTSMVRQDSTTLTLATLLANPAELRILHSPTPAINGANVVGQVGIDNIRAVPEPRPDTLCIVGVIALALVCLMTRRQRT